MRPRIIAITSALSTALAISCTAPPQPAGSATRSDSVAEASSENTERITEMVSQAERDKASAMTSGPKAHMAWFDQWVADDMVFTAPDGTVDPEVKKHVRENLALGVWKIEAVSIDNLSVRVFNESAVVTALQTEASHLHGKNSGGRFQYTHLWVTRNGNWKIVAAHASLLP